MAQGQLPKDKRLATRRDFLLKASLGLAGLVTLGGPVRNALKRSPLGSVPRFPGKGSIFQPRLDQRLKVWARWHNPFRR